MGNKSVVAERGALPKPSARRTTTEPARPEWRPLRRLPRRHVRLLAAAGAGLMVVVPAVVAYAAAASETPVHEARAELVVGSTGNANVDDNALLTQVSLLSSRGFVDDVVGLDEEETLEVLDHLSVTQVQGSALIRIALQDEDPERALEIVTLMAETHVEESRPPAEESEQAEQLTAETIAAERELVSARLLVAEQELAATKDQLRDLAGSLDPAAPALAENLRFERTRFANEVESYERRLLELELAEVAAPEPQEPVLGAVTMLGEPYLLDEPVEPRPLRSAAIGAFAGALLVAAGLTVFLRTRRG